MTPTSGSDESLVLPHDPPRRPALESGFVDARGAWLEDEMSKGGSRATLKVGRFQEGDAGGGVIDLGTCGPRRVGITSDRNAAELRQMDPAYLAIDEQRRIVIRRGGGVIAVVTSDVGQLRRCIEQDGVRFEADLPKVTERGGLSVPVRPLAAR